MSFPFLSLPAELRNQILRLVLIHHTPIVITSFSDLNPPHPQPLNLTPGILLINRATLTSGLPILYGENKFQAHPMLLKATVFAACVRRPVPQPYIPLIRRFHIRVRLDSDPFYTENKLRDAFNGVEELEVEVFRASYEMGSLDALDGFFGIRDVKKAKVHGSISEGLAWCLEGCMMSRGGEAYRFRESLGLDCTGMDPNGL